MSALPFAVSFVIPVRNDAARLAHCIRSIAANASPSATIDIVVVDNGSTDDSADAARRLGARVLTLNGTSVAELRNAGAAHATGNVLAFVDADHEIVGTWLAAARDAFDAADVAAAGALCLAPSDGTWVQRAYGALRGTPRGVHDVEWLGSGNMVMRRDAFEAVGGFDTSLTTCEDVDLCNRVRARGGRIVSTAGMRNVHFGDPATLWAVFKGELWRGRDNLRVSLRNRLTWRGLPSVVIPIADLVLLNVAIVGLVAAVAGAPTGLLVAGAALALIATAATLRVARSVARGGVGPGMVLRMWAVSVAFDVGRAFALVFRAPHRGRQTEAAVAQ